MFFCFVNQVQRYTLCIKATKIPRRLDLTSLSENLCYVFISRRNAYLHRAILTELKCLMAPVQTWYIINNTRACEKHWCVHIKKTWSPLLLAPRSEALGLARHVGYEQRDPTPVCIVIPLKSLLLRKDSKEGMLIHTLGIIVARSSTWLKCPKFQNVRNQASITLSLCLPSSIRHSFKRLRRRAFAIMHF